MDIIESLHPTPKAWLLNSALAPHLEPYCAHFRLGRYAATYSVDSVAGLAHFARWMTQCGLAVEQLDSVLVRTTWIYLVFHVCPLENEDRTLSTVDELATRVGMRVSSGVERL